MALKFGFPPRYLTNRKIGEGSFGEVYLGHSIITGEAVAIKLERSESAHQLLSHEAHVHKLLSGTPGIPSFKWFGTQHGYRVLISEMQGPSLEDLFNFCERKFTLKTVLLLADQILTNLEHVHSHDYLHRDIKPENMLIGQGTRANQVFLIDFGLAKRYRDSKTRAHNPYREHKALTGTARYTSINSHRGLEHSRRDDIASVAYMLIYFLRGGLPWQGIKADNRKHKYDIILERKESITPRLLCQGLPEEFEFLITYAKALKFYDRPNYAYLREIFRSRFAREGFSNDFTFDWSLRMLQTGQTSLPTKNWHPKAAAKPILARFKKSYPTQGHGQNGVHCSPGHKQHGFDRSKIES